MRTTARRVVTAAAAAAVTGVIAISVAAPSQAADLGTFSATCSGTLNTQSVSGRIGDTFTLAVTTGPCILNIPGYASPMVTGTPTTGTFATGATVGTYTLVGPGNFNLSMIDAPGLNAKGLILDVTVLADEAPAEAAPAPASYLQQVPVPVSGSCADVQDADLKWGTDVTGGWTKQWGEWQNTWACGRTLTNAGGSWHAA